MANGYGLPPIDFAGQLARGAQLGQQLVGAPLRRRAEELSLAGEEQRQRLLEEQAELGRQQRPFKQRTLAAELLAKESEAIAKQEKAQLEAIEKRQKVRSEGAKYIRDRISAIQNPDQVGDVMEEAVEYALDMDPTNQTGIVASTFDMFRTDIKTPQEFEEWKNSAVQTADSFRKRLKEAEDAQKPMSSWGKMLEDYNQMSPGPLKELTFSKLQSEAARGNMRIEVGPDGSLIYATGEGALMPTKPSKTALQKEIVDTQQALDSINFIEDLYDPEFLTYKGALSHSWSDIVNKLDPARQSEFAQGRQSFKVAVDQAFLTFRKWATGVAGSDKEMRQIEKATFSMRQSPQAFMAALNSVKRMKQQLIARNKAALIAGVNSEKEFKQFLKENPLEAFKTVDQRGDELLRQGKSDDEIFNILRSEGYIGTPPEIPKDWRSPYKEVK